MIIVNPIAQPSDATLRSELADAGKLIDRNYRQAKKAQGKDSGSMWDLMVHNCKGGVVEAITKFVSLHYGDKENKVVALAAKTDSLILVEYLVTSPRYRHLFDKDTKEMAETILAEMRGAKVA
jgi:hypothetical protein